MMEKSIFNEIYLHDGKYPDTAELVKKFESASETNKKTFYRELISSKVYKNPFIKKVVEDYEYKRSLYSI